VPLRKDIWRPAIVGATAADILARGSLDNLPWHWLPDAAVYCFTADPFALWQGDRLHVFVERFDYRDRHGRIDRLSYGPDLRLIESRPVLAELWHLSYPYLIEADGERWMLPEAFRSGRLTLYRADPFPDRWIPAATLTLDAVPIDATVTRHDGRWWMFYSPSMPKAARTGALHVAHADRLTGPWTTHPGNPVRIGRDGSRPGGTPVPHGEGLILPVQDCRATYGGAIRPLHITRLTPDRFEATLAPALPSPPQAGRFREGLHTLAAAGPVTLVDVKRTLLSARGLGIEVRRRWGGGRSVQGAQAFHEG
jgi:hypothetical protein